MSSMKSFINSFLLAIALIAVSACTPAATEKKAKCGVNEAFSSVSRSCYSIAAPNLAPIAVNVSATSVAEDVQSIITLSYTDNELDKATDCQITSLSNATVTSACACDVLGVCTVGVTGTSNYYGAAQFSYAVKANNAVSNTAVVSYTITAVNDAPSISVAAAQTTNEDVAKAVSFTINDVDSTLTCAGSVTVTSSSDAILVPIGSVVITGTKPNCIATVTPAANDDGISTIGLEVSDGTLVSSTTFNLTVNQVNDLPTMTVTAFNAVASSPVTTFINQTINEDNVFTVDFTLADVETTLDCNATNLSASSSNMILITPLTDVVFSGVYPNCIMTVTPPANLNGFSNITVIANDTNGGVTSNIFMLTVTAVNDAPTIAAIADQTILEDAVNTFSFNIADIDSTLTCASSVSVFSNSDTTLIPTSSIVITGTAPACTATLTPDADQSGFSDIVLRVTDGALTADEPFRLNVTYVDDPPYLMGTAITTVHTNEGGAVQTDGFQVDEDTTGTTGEDDQWIKITDITSDNPGVLPTTAIRLFYDLNDNGVEDAGESRVFGGGAVALEAADTDDSKDHSFYLKLDPVDGISGNANITLTITNGVGVTAGSSITTTFSFIVHPIAALHGGWENISSVGIKTDKLGAPVSTAEIQCNYNLASETAYNCSSSTVNCTGTASPQGSVVAKTNNILYWDSSAQRCYRSTSVTPSSAAWVEIKTSCPITREAGSNNSIITADPYTLPTPTEVGTYTYTTKDNKCFVSTGTSSNADWVEYVPAKVTLSWKPFTLVGSGSDSGVNIAGWNVYRREPGFDYNFKGGHLKNTSSTSVFTIADANITTFTDTTALAGKVYYYVVRPVDDTTRNFPTYTSEIFSEVRVLAAPENYAFVHRWMINQEICNGMNITTTTTPYHVDQTNNYRCEYEGPGETVVGPDHYYDYGKDILVDTQELGCAYAAAPKCTSNGCVGINAPTGLTAAQDDLYYNRSTGVCYRNNDGATSWTAMDTASVDDALATKLKSALNPPLVNITEATAETLCSVRSAPALTEALNGVELSSPVVKAALPTKKDFIAYSSHKVGVDDYSIKTLEQGFSLSAQSRCNSSNADGISTAYTDAAIPVTSFIYSIPGTFTSGIRSLYTGSIPWGSSKGTEDCVSRYGIQDLYGNVAEWTSDKMTCDRTIIPSIPFCTSDPTSSFGSYNFNATGDYYAFDLSVGPYNDSDGSGLPDSPDVFLDNWIFENTSYNAGKFSYQTGMPINTDIDTQYPGANFLNWILNIGPSSGITTDKLHEDGIIINGVNGQTGAFAVGGSYLSGASAGRFNAELIESTLTKRSDVGLRCIIPIDPSKYIDDSAFHPYEANY